MIPVRLIFAIITAFLFVNGVLFFAVFKLTLAGIIIGALGFFSLFLFIFLARHEIRRLWSNPIVRKQISQYSFALMFIVLLLIINYALTFKDVRFDLTKYKRFSLSPESKQLLTQIDSPVELIGYFRPNRKQEFQDLANVYHHENDLFNIEYKNPDLHPQETKTLKIPRSGGIILKVKDKTVLIDKLKEEHVTGALSRLLRKQKLEICLISGHGEPEYEDASASGISVAMSALSQRGYNVRNVATAVEEIPETCSILLIQATSRQLGQNEEKKILNAINTHRTVFLFEPGASSSFKNILKHFGVKPMPGFIVDPTHHTYQSNISGLLIRSGSAHPITTGIKSAVLIPTASALEIRGSSPRKGTDILNSTPKSWNETDQKTSPYRWHRDETVGPFQVAVILEPDESETPKTADNENEEIHPIFVIGDADFITNRYFELFDNQTLILNVFDYLSKEVAMLSKRKADPKGLRVALSSQNLKLILFISLFLFPLALLSLGIYIWLSMRGK
ncbi:Gldg family protein [Bdellovibrionota bacterium]